MLHTVRLRLGNKLSSVTAASQSSAFSAPVRDMVERNWVASAAPPPSSEASVMLMTGLMGALRFEKQSGSKDANTRISSVTGRGSRRREAFSQPGSPKNAKISSSTEQIGRLKPAAKHATPDQC